MKGIEPEIQRDVLEGMARGHFELMPLGIHWPELDEDLGIAGMLRGRPAA